jgi:chemotaxis protein CheD
MTVRTAPTKPLPGFEGINGFWDHGLGSWIKQIMPGDCYVTKGDEIIATVLGSCISTCIRDPHAKVGGMNHFMLPSAPKGDREDASARYGCYALEQLLNALYKHGAKRERLEVKVFGGGRVIPGLSDVGEGNIAFVRQFLATEGLALRAEDVGDNCARRLRYHPLTGKASVQHLPVSENARIATAETAHRREVLKKAEGPGDVELF